MTAFFFGMLTALAVVAGVMLALVIYLSGRW